MLHGSAVGLIQLEAAELPLGLHHTLTLALAVGKAWVFSEAEDEAHAVDETLHLVMLAEGDLAIELLLKKLRVLVRSPTRRMDHCFLSVL